MTQVSEVTLNQEPNMDISRRIAELKKLQLEHNSKEEEYIKEWNVLKAKYIKQFGILYDKRHKILNESNSVPATDSPGTKGVPSFWLTALKNHRLFSEMIRPADEDVLKYLKDITSEWLDINEQTSFKIVFEFEENPYFEPTSLVKIYRMDKADDEGDNVFMHTVGTTMHWKPDMDIRQTIVKKKQRHSKTREIRYVEEKTTGESFFDLFRSYELPPQEAFEQMSKQEMTSIEEEIEEEFDFGCILREKIIPKAIGWYLGEEDDELTDASDEDEDEDEELSEESSSEELADSKQTVGKTKPK